MIGLKKVKLIHFFPGIFITWRETHPLKSVKSEFSCHGTTKHCQLLEHSVQIFHKLSQKLGTEKFSEMTWSTRSVWKNVSPRPIYVFARVCWNCCPLPTSTTQLFPQGLLSYNPCRVSNFFPALTTCANSGPLKNSTSPATRCHLDDWQRSKENWKSCSSKCLCKCTESYPTLSTKTCIKRNLHLFWKNHLLVSFPLEIIVGSIF